MIGRRAFSGTDEVTPNAGYGGYSVCPVFPILLIAVFARKKEAAKAGTTNRPARANLDPRSHPKRFSISRA
jgi:hypothetical protein